MADKTKEVGIRLSVKDAETAKAALAQFGTSGEAALKRIEAAGRPASASLLALSSAVEHSEKSGTELFKAMALSALGPVAAFLSLAGAVEGTKQAMEDFSKVNDNAKSSALDAEFFQGIAYQAKLGGVGIDELTASLETFAKNSGQAAVGTGRMVTQLKLLDPELLRAIQSTGSQEERLKLVADAISKETDASRKAAIATAAFGQSGVKLVDIFDGGRAAIDRMQQSARDMGIIVPDSVIANADALGDKFDTATTIIDTQFKQALINLAPWLVNTASALAQVTQGLGIMLDQTREISDRVLLTPLQNQLVATENKIADLKQLIADQQKSTDAMPDSFLGIGNPIKSGNQAAIQGYKQQLDQQYQLASQYQDRIATLQGMGKPTTPPPPLLKPPVDPAATRAADAAQKKIDAVNKALDLQAQNLGETNRQQEINNRLSAAGVTIDSTAGKLIADKAGALYDLKRGYDAANQAASFLAQTGESGIEGLLDGTKSLSDAVGDLTSALLKAVLQAELLGSGPLAGMLGTASDTSAPGGILGSLLSGWLGSAGGGASAGLGMGANGVAGGFAGGGYTGAGARNEPAGLVHRGEYVFDALSVNRLGVDTLDRMRSLPGYAAGGYVGSAPRAAGVGGQPAVSVTIRNQTGTPIAEPQVKTTRNGNNIDIDVLLAQSLTKPGGKPGRALETQYGLTRQLTRR